MQRNMLLKSVVYAIYFSISLNQSIVPIVPFSMEDFAQHIVVDDKIIMSTSNCKDLEFVSA